MEAAVKINAAALCEQHNWNQGIDFEGDAPSGTNVDYEDKERKLRTWRQPVAGERVITSSLASHREIFTAAGMDQSGFEPETSA